MPATPRLPSLRKSTRTRSGSPDAFRDGNNTPCGPRRFSGILFDASGKVCRTIAGDGYIAGGKSGLRRAGCWITSSQRELKDSATETDRRWPRPAAAQARVEPWCKRPRGHLATDALVHPIRRKTKKNAWRLSQGPALARGALGWSLEPCSNAPA